MSINLEDRARALAAQAAKSPANDLGAIGTLIARALTSLHADPSSSSDAAVVDAVRWLSEAKNLLTERNTVLHAVPMAHYDAPADSGRSQFTGESSLQFFPSSKNGRARWQPVTADRFSILSDAMEDLVDRWAATFVAWSVATGRIS